MVVCFLTFTSRAETPRQKNQVKPAGIETLNTAMAGPEINQPLLGLAVTLVAIEPNVRGFGFLGLGGVIASVIGSLILINVDAPELRLPLGLVLGVVIPTAFLVTVMLRLAFKSRRAKLTVGEQPIIGLIGRAETDFKDEGTVFVRGELWKARSRSLILKDAEVQVAGLHGLTLEVEALRNEKAGAGVMSSRGETNE